MTRDVRLILVALIIWGAGEGLFFYLTPLYLKQLGADPIQIGIILGIAAIMLTVGHVPAGILSDRYGPKIPMVGGWSTGVVATAIMYLAPGLAAFAIGLSLYNFAAFSMSPMSAYLSRARGTWTLARALTTTSSGFSAGAILGSLVGGRIAEAAGIRSVFGIAVGVFVISTLCVLQLRPQAPIGHESRPPFAAVTRDPRVRWFLALVFLSNLVLWLGWPLTGVYLQSVRSVSLSDIGTLGSFNALGIVLISLGLGRLHPRKGFLLAQVLVALSVVLLCFGTGIPWYAAGYFLIGGFRTARTLAAALVEVLVQPAVVGLAFGLTETIASLGVVLANPIAGVLYSALPSLPYYAGLALGIVMLMANAVWLPRMGAPDLALRSTSDCDIPESEVSHGVVD